MLIIYQRAENSSSEEAINHFQFKYNLFVFQVYSVGSSVQRVYGRIPKQCNSSEQRGSHAQSSVRLNESSTRESKSQSPKRTSMTLILVITESKGGKNRRRDMIMKKAKKATKNLGPGHTVIVIFSRRVTMVGSCTRAAHIPR